MLNTNNITILTHDLTPTPPSPHNLTVFMVEAPVHGVEDEAEWAVLLVQLDVVGFVLTH